MSLNIDQQIDRIIRDLKTLATILNCPGTPKVSGSTAKSKEKPYTEFFIETSDYKFEESDPGRGRELHEYYTLRDGEDSKDFRKMIIKKFEENEEDIQILSTIDCLIEGKSWRDRKDPVNGDWGFDFNGSIHESFVEITDFSDFLWKRFNITEDLHITKIDITEIKSALADNPFIQLLKKFKKPVHYQTIWECYDILKNHRDKIENLRRKHEEPESQPTIRENAIEERSKRKPHKKPLSVAIPIKAPPAGRKNLCKARSMKEMRYNQNIDGYTVQGLQKFLVMRNGCGKYYEDGTKWIWAEPDSIQTARRRLPPKRKKKNKK